MKRGILLLAHGSRDALWRKPVEAVAQRIAAQSPATPVICAYLELTEPDFAAGARSLVESGATDIRVVPMFLGVGKHAREDLPKLVAAAHEHYQGVKFDLRPAVGESPELIELLANLALSSSD